MAPLEYKYLKQNPKGNTEEALFYFIYLSYEVLGKQFEDFFKKNFQLSPNQTHLLCYLKFYKKISMSVLADMMNSSRQHMTKLVDSLGRTEAGCPLLRFEDRRTVYVEPTETALMDIDTGERRFISHLLRNIACLPEEKQAETINAINLTSEFLSRIKIEINDIPESPL